MIALDDQVLVNLQTKFLSWSGRTPAFRASADFQRERPRNKSNLLMAERG